MNVSPWFRLASMEPRPFSRGDLNLLVKGAKHHVVLQWSRDLSVAET